MEVLMREELGGEVCSPMKHGLYSEPADEFWSNTGCLSGSPQIAAECT